MADLVTKSQGGTEQSEQAWTLENKRESDNSDDPPFHDDSLVQDHQDITERICEFVATIKYTDLEMHIVEKLKELLLDYVGVAAGGASLAESSPHIYSAVLALVGSSTGTATVITKKRQLPEPYAALMNGAYGHSLDADCTHSSAVLHAGVSVIPAALAQAESLSPAASGRHLLTAMAVGYELTCRLGIGLGTGSYPRGFHNTGTAGIMGAVAAICNLRQLKREVVANAFGLALSKAAGSMQYLENGSWNKRLHPGFAAHDAFMCVALAEAGVVGAARPFEGQYGLLHAYSETGDATPLLDGWGSRWEFEATALKPFPACRMTHTQITVAAKMSVDHTEAHGKPEHIKISLPRACMLLVGVPAPNKRHPITVVDAQFSSYFQTAVAWVYGSTLGWKVYEKMKDTAVMELCDRISCQIDDRYSGMASQLSVVFEDGYKVEEELLFPVGEKENPFRTEDVQAKAHGFLRPVYGEEKSKRISNTISRVEEEDVAGLMCLLRGKS